VCGTELRSACASVCLPGQNVYRHEKRVLGVVSSGVGKKRTRDMIEGVAQARVLNKNVLSTLGEILVQCGAGCYEAGSMLVEVLV